MEKCLQSMEFLGESPFIQLPKSINSMKMSSDAKLLYANLADLMKLSELNGYRDEQGLYAFCSLEYIQEVLCCSRPKASKVIKELESNHLICKKRIGLCKSNRYYLLSPQANALPAPVEQQKSAPAEGKELVKQKEKSDTYGSIDYGLLDDIYRSFRM